MRKSILRFGALALMSLMSISVWAQTFSDTSGNMYSVKDDGSVELITIGGGNSTTTKLDLTKTIPNGGIYYSVTSVAAQAGLSYSGEGNVTVILPETLQSIGFKAFANAKLTIQFAGGKLVCEEMGTRAFENATIAASSAVGNYFDFSNANLGTYAFSNATFSAISAGGTDTKATIWMGMAPLPEGVFCASSPKTDILTIEFDDNNGLTSVSKNALKNRAITNFGYRVGENALYYLPKNLSEIGEGAFQGVTNLNINKNFTFQGQGRIKKVCNYAFSGCNWMNEDIFAHVCGSFGDGFEYGSHSFEGCSFTKVDLTNSTVGVRKSYMGSAIYNGVGVPEYAFADNVKNGNASIVTIKLPAASNFVAIQKGAFENNALQTVELPEGIQYVEDYALSAETEQTVNDAQENLFLPQSLREIGNNALDNRYITNVYAYPVFDASKVPAIGQNSLSIQTMTIPVVAPWKEGNPAQPITAKDKYESQNWVSPNLTACNLAYASFSGNKDFDDNGVKYSVVAPTAPGTDEAPSFEYDNGFSTATITKFTAESATIYGMLLIEDAIRIPTSDKVGAPTYDYDVIALVKFPTSLENSTAKGANIVSNITFEPKKSNTNDNLMAKTTANFYNDKFYTLPSSAFKSWYHLTGITLGDGITAIPEEAFAGTGIRTLTLPENITSVGASAFNDVLATEETPEYASSLTEVSLPATLQYFGAGAFGGINLERVRVQYEDAQYSWNGWQNVQTNPGKQLPALSTDPFRVVSTGVYKPVLVVSTDQAYYSKRVKYNEDAFGNWKKFFDQTVTVNVSHEIQWNNNARSYEIIHFDRVATEDINGRRTYVLNDANTYKLSVDVSGNAKVAVQYNRTLTDELQPWFVPFNYKYTGEEGCKFYYIYDTKQSGTGADATTSIELMEVKNDKDQWGNDLGYATIKANTAYVVKADVDGTTISFGADEIKDTEDFTMTVGNVQNEFTFTGIYEKRVSAAVNSGEANWYALGNDGIFYNYANKGNSYILKAYRFYMTYQRLDDNPYGLVKFVVLDDEDATGIKDVNAETTANGAMFDLTGRQITSPAKGQVYIQNGVKKLAK